METPNSALKFRRVFGTITALSFGGVIGFVIAGYLLRDWNLSNTTPILQVLAPPVAAVLTGGAAIAAAVIAFKNGEETRKQDRMTLERNLEQQQRHYEQSSTRETERILRSRFVTIVELLSETNNLGTREAAAYSLVALADDWANHYGEFQERAEIEQQICLNLLSRQLRDPISHNSGPELRSFKRTIQALIFDRFTPRDENSGGAWSDLTLDLSECHLHEAKINGMFFSEVYFPSATFHGITNFSNSIFQNEANFRRARFEKAVIFKHVQFDSEANFRRTIFNGSADFRSAEFNGIADFYAVRFHNICDFCKTTFNNIAGFWNAKFTSFAIFTDVTFNSYVTFKGAKISGIAPSSINKIMQLNSLNETIQDE